MPPKTEPPPTFSPYRKWGIGLNVALLILAVAAVVAMLNYISQVYFLRGHWSGFNKEPLSRQTLGLLHSITNRVKVIVYYDKDDPLYPMIVDLLSEYKLANRTLSVQLLDYQRDPAAALQLRSKYPFLAATEARNLIIFDCDGRVKQLPGNLLGQYSIEQTGDKEEPFRRKITAFQGETAFDAALLEVTSPKKLHAYFLQGDGEPGIDGHDKVFGYDKFAAILWLNYVQPHTLSLLGTNQVPSDCNLLVIAGPQHAIPEIALQKIDQYLTQGGRLLVLFNYATVHFQTGLEPILAKWGVQVGSSILKDPQNFSQHDLIDIVVSSFAKHPIVDPLQLTALEMIQPRAIDASPAASQSPDAPHVEKLAFTGPRAFAVDAPEIHKSFPLMVAVEKGAIKGVITERGATRMVVIGDSTFLENQLLDAAANRDFANYLVNWLLDRSQLLQGPGPRLVTEYKLMMTNSQLQRAKWILMGGMPGLALVLGWLVWLTRRH
jgi:gliding motility-associatede transport system auxiliary component